MNTGCCHSPRVPFRVWPHSSGDNDCCHSPWHPLQLVRVVWMCQVEGVHALSADPCHWVLRSAAMWASTRVSCTHTAMCSSKCISDCCLQLVDPPRWTEWAAAHFTHPASSFVVCCHISTGPYPHMMAHTSEPHQKSNGPTHWNSPRCSPLSITNERFSSGECAPVPTAIWKSVCFMNWTDQGDFCSFSQNLCVAKIIDSRIHWAKADTLWDSPQMGEWIGVFSQIGVHFESPSDFLQLTESHRFLIGQVFKLWHWINTTHRPKSNSGQEAHTVLANSHSKCHKNPIQLRLYSWDHTGSNTAFNLLNSCKPQSCST